MPSHRITARPPRGSGAAFGGLVTDPAALESVLRDAAHYPGGFAPAVARPASEAEVAAVVRAAERVLPVGAQSSLTGGATPMGEVVLSLSKLAGPPELLGDAVRVGAGLSLSELQVALAERGAYYPPVPSYSGATVGGVIATNAAGAATFKHGSTRDWVRALTVVLASGEVLDLERGQCLASPEGYFEVDGPLGLRRVPVPGYRMPDVAKRSAGYYAAPEMDLVDLFVGSEGTLGVVTEAVLGVVSPAPALAVAVVPCADEAAALALTRALRDEALQTRRSGDPSGLDVSAVEYLDLRSLEIVREDGADRRSGVPLPRETGALLLVQVELSPERAATAEEDLAAALEPDAPDGPLARLVRLLERFGVLEAAELALPNDRRRLTALLALREAVPDGVNARVAALKRDLDSRITKTAADPVVPFHRLPEMIGLFRDAYAARGLDHAIWGHLSDGNLHPNLIPRSFEDVLSARDVVLECGRAVVAMGGCPLAEHGVGRNPVKQALLTIMYGPAGLEEMRRVKRALDPTGKLAPGNLFPVANGF